MFLNITRSGSELLGLTGFNIDLEIAYTPSTPEIDNIMKLVQVRNLLHMGIKLRLNQQKERNGGSG